MSAVPATTPTILTAPLLRCCLPIVSARPLVSGACPKAASRRSISCLVAVSTEVSSSSSEDAEGSDAESKVGARVRVNVPLKVYHVGKAPELDLCGMEGVIKQYAGLWKGKRISANLPFKVEFFVSVEGQSKPVKFFAHLKEDEFEYLPSD
ncbi:Lipoyl synthase protein [Dioscorea alata]|uniref:Lipoyl synthase protein n=1 Tax=Dioscorea alata TaxID=55571 RepID=A0ACB7UUV0_DIOAL|nr:Lipoyl synthase protein [Dioscorea alata]